MQIWQNICCFFLNIMNFIPVIYLWCFKKILSHTFHILKLFLNFNFFAKSVFFFLYYLECKKQISWKRRGGKQISEFFWQGGWEGTSISGGMEHLIPGVWSTSFLADIICERPLKERFCYWANILRLTDTSAPLLSYFPCN